ncbi:hypothetical protein QTI17_21395 [Variovorax sp. J31P179]|uniref:hypothetical protein n=1 Tax=Variovorax sp. J31P179 TaxID=3053508 RepID=UPI002577F559|nr:hypothetical protein [Variovorax sp. J31P179]MDM0083155.1 hypothetical protein [Variovorax sp. J31P179]
MKSNRASRRQQRIAERRANRRAAHAANVPDISVETVELPDDWRLAVLRHSHRDPRVLGREDEAVEHVQALAPPFMCGGCGCMPDLLAVGVVDSPTLDQLGLRCPACRSSAQGLYSDLAVLGTREAMSDETMRMLVRGFEQRVAADAETMAKDAAWFARNPGRRLRVRPPTNDMERGLGAPPAMGMQLVCIVRRDAFDWRTPDTLWVPGGGIHLDIGDTPAQLTPSMVDALHEAVFETARDGPISLLDYGPVIARAKAIHRAHEQAAEAARTAAQRSDGDAS